MTPTPKDTPSTAELIADLSTEKLIDLLRMPSNHRVFDPKAVYATLDRELLNTAADRLQSLTERERDVRAMIAAAPTPPVPPAGVGLREEIIHALRDTCARMEVRENIPDADVMVYAGRYADAILALLSPQGIRP